MTRDTAWRKVPDRVIVVSGGAATEESVTGVVYHPAGTHRSIIRTDTGAIEVQTAKGARWYGCDAARIGADLRMYVSGCDTRDEVRMGWEVTP